MLCMSQDVGISADENRHILQAEKVYNYFKSKGEDKSALEKTGIDPMQYNGQSFDNLMYYITLKLNIRNYIEMRHFFNALIGWFIILITGLLAKKIYDYEGAILAILLLFITPRFLGHSLNNNKDIPFALGFVLSIYGMIGFLKTLPKLSYKYIIFTVLGIAIAISVRMAGIVSIAFLGLYSVILFLTQKPWFNPFEKNKLNLLKKLAIIIPLVASISYFLGILYWPFMREDPIKNINVVLEATSSHPVGLSQLFEGKLILSTEIPWYYTLRYLLISYPLVILIGIGLSLILAPFALKKDKFFLYFMILFAFGFVFFWMSYNNTNFYGGIRHLLFIYPLAICLNVFGFVFLKELLIKETQSWLKYIPYVLIAILLVNPVLHIIRNYPYSYVYFNEIAGGVKNVKDKYETDYFQHSLRHATEWFVTNELPKYTNNSTKVKIVTNDNFNTGYYLRDVLDKVEYNYVRYYDKSRVDWDYAIFYCAYITPFQITNNLWPPKETIHVEEVDEFPIAAVVKRVSHEDFKGYQAIENNHLDEAKLHFQNFLKVYPENDEAWEGLSHAMMKQRDFDSTIINAEKALKYNPRSIVARMLIASAQNNKKDYVSALNTTNQILKIRNEFGDAHYQKGIALKNLDKPNDALKEFEVAVNYDEKLMSSYYHIGEILNNYKNYQKALEAYNLILKKHPNDFVATINTGRTYYLMGDTKKAKQIIEKVDPAMQNRLETIVLKCRIALDEKDLRMVSNYLQITRNINNSSDVFFLRAKYELTQNNKQTAIDLLKQGKEIEPINREIKELLVSLETNQTQTTIQNQQSTGERQSIMYEKPKQNKTNPLTSSRN